ncbi:type I-C CRISPR-associated protein Cas8c/Csd1 [Paenibacillus koleovorans]|uniref:type I-C CRISPR-associated protein Cas8c/Csd1 n=1 Tax=Paenibacillus koleovorans TaxID=121608 RepID=UPI000FD86C8D|nr:type I-C CRISPR-associated protein Cas8c/Csd1 [Paenibacillus koleovorans]
MILQALYERYETLRQDPKSQHGLPHNSPVKIAYALELSKTGELLRITDIRIANGYKRVPLQLNVPEQPARQSNIKPYFLCDKPDYLLGFAANPAKQQDSIRRFEHSKALHQQVLAGCESPEALAVLLFFSKWDPTSPATNSPIWDSIKRLPNAAMELFVFRLEGSKTFLHESNDIKDCWVASKLEEQENAVTGQCLVTGQPNAAISRIHDVKIKGVRGALSSGAAVVSFNKSAFDSYNKSQSYNAPVSLQAAFGYTTALNELLASGRHCIPNLGDMTVVFWTNASTTQPSQQLDREAETIFAEWLSMEDVHRALTNASRGKISTVASASIQNVVDQPFHILGLSSNNARISVRFYWEGHFGRIMNQLAQHQEDMEIVSTQTLPAPSLQRILAEVGKNAPALTEELFASIVTGKLYPYSLYVSILNRIKADLTVSSIRTSIIKAYLTRYARIHEQTPLKEVLTVSLNEATPNSPYRLGRLFAVLERTQLEAAGGYNKLNVTIKNRYFSAASATPASVFPLLLKLSQHHISKADYGHNREREIQEILSPMETFPKRLDLNQQGQFILGYYHQREHFFSGRTESEAAEEKETANTVQTPTKL